MRRPGLWMTLLLVVIFGGFWLASRAFGAGAAARTLFLVLVPGVLVSVILKGRRQGTRASLAAPISAAATGALAWVWGWFDTTFWIKVLFTMLVVVPIMSLTNAAFRADIRRGQRCREIKAEAIARRVIAGDHTGGPFALYLRPFFTTGRDPTEQLPPEVGGETEVPAHVDLEVLLDRALRDRCPIVALGRSGDVTEGPARIATSDDKWRPLVTALADQAAFVVILPLARPSTSWELQWLTEHGLLGKVLMVMPETVRPVPSGVVRTTQGSDRIFDVGVKRWNQGEHQFDQAAEWRRATQTARELGIALPPLAEVGALFTIDVKTGQVARIMPLALSTTAKRVGYLRAAITSLGLFNADLDPPPNPAAALAHAVFFRGATLEYALMRAADGFVLWGDIRTAAMLLSRAAADGARPPRFVQGYLNALPERVQQRSQLGDQEGAACYKAAIPALLGYPELAALVKGKRDADSL